MADPCQSLGRFFDGHLSPTELDPYREHLATCPKCQRGLEELLQLDAVGIRHLQIKSNAPPQLVPLPQPRPWRRWPAAVGSGLTLLAASLALVVYQPWGVPDGVWQPGGSDVRLTVARSSYSRAAPYHKLATGNLGPGTQIPELPYQQLGKLGDDHLAIASALLVRGDPGLVEQALKQLAYLPDESPDSDSERAMAYLVRSNADRSDYESALRFAQRALEKNPKHGPALWNKALALEKLRLTMLAAKTFDEVAQLSEPGWATEARYRADVLRGQTDRMHREFRDAIEGFKKAVKSGSAFPQSALGASVARKYFYEVVRSQTSARNVLALLPVAVQLDQRSGGTHLHDYVQWVAGRDFGVRARLADKYRQIVPPSDAPDAEALKRELWASGEADLAMGALVYSSAGRSEADIERFEKLARETKDPWFLVLAEQQRALMLESRDLRAAQQALERALQIAGDARLEYRSLHVTIQLLNVLLRASDLDGARDRASQAWELATRLGDWELLLSTIDDLAQLARLGQDPMVSRAYLEEAVERSREDHNPAQERFFHQQLAWIDLDSLHVAAAREHLDAAIATRLPLNVSGALVLAEVARQRPSPLDRQVIDAFRATIPGMSSSERALATNAVGRWTIEVNPDEGRKLLRDAIAQTASPGAPDGDASRARAYSYTTLIMDAGKNKDFQGVLALFGEEANEAFPPTCAVALSVDSERGVAVARGASGAVSGEYDGTRTVTFPERLDGLVSPAMLKALAGCSEVKVVARAPIYGKLGALPGEMAWSYKLLGRSGPQASGTSAAAGPGGHLIVQSVALSDRAKRLGLATPQPWIRSPPSSGGPTLLDGASATASRILSEMRPAADIDIVTHSLVNPVSNEAYLVVAPGPTGDGVLRATQIRDNPLPNRPIVTLSACHAAHSMPLGHEARSLPAAFLLSGASAVLAADEEIPEAEGPAFFDEVRARIRGGTTPAVALREVRQSWLSQGQGMNWVKSVLVFE